MEFLKWILVQVVVEQELSRKRKRVLDVAVAAGLSMVEIVLVAMVAEREWLPSYGSVDI